MTEEPKNLPIFIPDRKPTDTILQPIDKSLPYVNPTGFDPFYSSFIRIVGWDVQRGVGPACAFTVTGEWIVHVHFRAYLRVIRGYEVDQLRWGQRKWCWLDSIAMWNAVQGRSHVPFPWKFSTRTPDVVRNSIPLIGCLSELSITQDATVHIRWQCYLSFPPTSSHDCERWTPSSGYGN